MQALARWLWNRWDFFLHHFLTHFCHFLPLPLTLVLIFGLLYGVIGTGVGAQYLIYHDEPDKRAAAGFALTLLGVECLLIGYLFEFGRKRRRFEGGFLSYAVQTTTSFFLCLGVVWVVSELMDILANILPLRYAGQEQMRDVHTVGQLFRPKYEGGVLVGAACALATAVAVFAICRLRTAIGGCTEEPLDRNDSVDPTRTEVARNTLSELSVTGVVGDVTKTEPPSHFVYLLWLTAAALAWYVIVTYVASKTTFVWGWVRPELIVGLILVPVFVFVLNLIPILRRSRDALLTEVQGNLRFPDSLAGRRYRAVIGLFTAVSIGSLMSLSFVESTASPVPPVCLVLLTILAVYGFLSVVVRRGLTILMGGVVVMLALSGTPPYKIRFPGLDSTYKREAGPPTGLPNLHAEAESDWGRQEALAKFIHRLSSDPATKDIRDQIAAMETKVRSTSRIDASGQPRPERKDLEKRLDERRRELRTREYEVFRAEPAFADAAAFGGTRVVPLRDTRPGAPLERAAEEYYADRSPADQEAEATRLLWMSDIKFLSADDRKKRDPRKPLVIVTVSGGGLRSAAWTLRVLQELEKRFAKEKDRDGRPIHFPSHVRIIAGASGGMLGAGYYSATLTAPELMKTGPAREAEMREHYEMLTQDFLTPIVKGAVYGDLPLFLSPWPIKHDRGRVLEEAWVRELRQSKADPKPSDPANETAAPLALSFTDLRNGEIAGWRPSLIFSPMLIEDGRRLLVSNLDLRWVAANDGSSLDPQGEMDRVPGGSKNYSFEAFELFRLFPAAKDVFRLRTAVRMSASFPYFSPAVSLPTWPRRRVVDAGYYDNYGVSIAASWLFSGRHEEWIRENVSKVLIVQIRDGVSDGQRRLRRLDPDLSSTLSRSVEEFISPLEGLDNGRVGSSSFRNDGQLELLTKYYRTSRNQSPSAEHTKRFLTTVTFEFPLTASLSWYLSADERNAIDAAARGEVPDVLQRIPDAALRDEIKAEMRLHLKRLDSLVEWWHASTDP